MTAEWKISIDRTTDAVSTMLDDCPPQASEVIRGAREDF